MPTPPLPWFKVWIGATSHGKVRQLSDALFRTWVELLDAAAQQPVRGRFKSAREAASIVRRPVAHIKLLIAPAGLIDETPDGLMMHDWDPWQRWRKEEANNTGSTHDHPPDQHTNDTGSTRDEHTNNTAPLRIEEEGEEEGEKERDLRPENPPAPTGQPPSANGANGYLKIPKGSGPVIDAFEAIGVGVHLNARDHAAIKHTTAPPELIAEVYDQVARCLWGDDFMRKRLSVHEAINWVNAYVEWKAEEAHRRGVA